MNSKKFEYTHRDIGHLKKDICFRTVFFFIFLGLFIWQITTIIMEALNSSISVYKTISSVVVLICSLMLALISLMYVFKNFRIISAIKLNGRCVSSVQMLVKTQKKSFLWLYNLLIQFLTLITSLVLISSITYSILQATYMSHVSFYMPLLFTICISGFNSIYHVKDEIKIQNNVHEYNAY